jgi:hypothetical protein
MRTLESKIPAMITELVTLANSVSMYDRYSCEYIENLSDVNYTVLKKAFRRADTNGDLSLSSFTNSLLRGKLLKTN